MKNLRKKHQEFSNSDENQLKISEALYLGLGVTFFLILIDLVLEYVRNYFDLITIKEDLWFKLILVLVLLTIYGVTYNQLKSKQR